MWVSGVRVQVIADSSWLSCNSTLVYGGSVLNVGSVILFINISIVHIMCYQDRGLFQADLRECVSENLNI